MATSLGVHGDIAWRSRRRRLEFMAMSLGVHGATIESKSSNSLRAFQTLVTQAGDRGSLGLLFSGGGKVTLFDPNPTAGSPGILFRPRGKVTLVARLGCEQSLRMILFLNHQRHVAVRGARKV